jgi:hypothetical protein
VYTRVFSDEGAESPFSPFLVTNCTSVQNLLTSLHEASEAARRAIAAQPGPTVLIGHSFSGMIVTDVGVEARVLYAAQQPFKESLAEFQRLRTAIPIDCGQSFRLIADSIPAIADRVAPIDGFMGSRVDLCVKLATVGAIFWSERAKRGPSDPGGKTPRAGSRQPQSDCKRRTHREAHSSVRRAIDERSDRRVEQVLRTD